MDERVDGCVDEFGCMDELLDNTAPAGGAAVVAEIARSFKEM